MPTPTPTPSPPPVAAPEKKAPAPPIAKRPVKAAAPKVKKPGPPMGDQLVRFLPVLMLPVGAGLTVFREFGFEGGVATCWALAGWAIGMIVRLLRMYPMKPFKETTLEALAGHPEATPWRGIPAILQGVVLLADEQAPKGEVVFSQEGRTLPLNRLGAFDMIPRLFGLSNPRQLLKGEVLLKGWYRKAAGPFLEVQEIRAGKTFRRSMVRGLRWASALMVLVLSIVISFALE
jgi:hypothetical protein